MRPASLVFALALAAVPLPAGAAAATGAAAGVRVAPATPGAVRLTVTIPEPRWVPGVGEAGTERLELDGYQPTGLPGEPGIPARTLLVAVPPLGDVRLTAAASEPAVHEGVTLAPNLGLGESREPVVVERRLEAYGAAGSARPAGARLLEVTWMRNQRVARIAIEPAAYEPAARRLTLARRVDVELAVSVPGVPGPPAEPDDPFEPVYRAALANYEQGRAWRRPDARSLAAAAKRAGIPLAAQAALAVPPDTSVYVGRRWIKLAVQRTGFVAVNFSRLRGLQLFDPTDPAPFDSLRLFTWPGRTVLPEDSYCDTCDYREVALGIVRDVTPPLPGDPTRDGPPDGNFADNNDAFYFFAQGPEGWASDYDPRYPDTSYVNHPYERFNYYYLTVATPGKPVTTGLYPSPPLRIGTGAGGTRDVTPDGSETPVATVPGRLHVEQDLEYWPDASAIRSTLPWEKWFWRSLVPGQSFSHTLDLTDADTTQPARFRLRHWGLSSNLFLRNCSWPGFDHRLDLDWNGVLFPRAQWQGFWSADRGARTFDTTGVFLRRTGNRVALSVPFYTVPGCPGFLDRSGLAFYEYYYARRLEPAGDAIEFRTAPGAGRFGYDLGPFVKTPSTFLFDITEPLRPVLLNGAETSGSAGAYRLAFADTQSVSHRYAIVPDSILVSNSALLPASQVSDAPSTSDENLRSATQAADYLVIYFDGFKAAADSLAAWRRVRLPLMTGSAPHLAKAVPVSALYDQFSGGRTDPGAIRNFLRSVAGWSRRPLYVTFLGDASFDFKDITGRAVPGQPGCLLPSFENNFDTQFLIRRQYATDDWIANVDDPVAVLPDYLTGRIPAGDAASALDVVTRKILAYERNAPFGEYRNTVLLMADDNAQGQDCDPIGWGHVSQTDRLNQGHTPAETDREYIYLHTFPTGPGGTKPGARAQLFKDLNRGAAILNFVGHGSPFKMTDESTFLDSDAGTLVNGLKLPLLVAASCDVGKFNDPTVQSLGERLFMSTNGGCIGVISATEQALSGLNSFLNSLIYDALFTRDTITVAGVQLPAVGQYHLPLSAALLAAKSVPEAQGTNSEKYQLMGDAATQLNLPRLWTEISLADAQGVPVTQFTRGQTLTFSGRVLDRPGGTLVPMDGVASVLIEDSAPTNLTPNECQAPIPYVFSAGPIYHGDVTLQGGTFQGRFVVSLDATAGTAGRIRAYATGRTAAGQSDGVGDLRADVVAGAPPAGDDAGPRITLSFAGGSTNVRPDATLRIDLFDDNGIMTTGHAPQNSIVVTVDGNTTTRTDVTSTFRYAADSHRAGTATFQLPGLAAGPHEVRVSAADNLATGLDAVRHRSSATLEFNVVDTPPLRVTRTFLFPNPVLSGGAGGGGVFVVDAPGDSVNTMVRIYTLAGKLVRVLRQMGGVGQAQLAWDGLDDESRPLAQGTYLYKVYVSAREADGSSSARQRATAEGRFVVHRP
jgi:hypothetical protein